METLEVLTHAHTLTLLGQTHNNTDTHSYAHARAQTALASMQILSSTHATVR